MYIDSTSDYHLSILDGNSFTIITPPFEYKSKSNSRILHLNFESDFSISNVEICIQPIQDNKNAIINFQSLIGGNISEVEYKKFDIIDNTLKWGGKIPGNYYYPINTVIDDSIDTFDNMIPGAKGVSPFGV